MSKHVPTALYVAAPAAIATTNGTGVEISDYTDNAQVVLNSAVPAASQTLDVKIQHSRDNGSTDAWADAGVAFVQVGNATANNQQSIVISSDLFKKYIRTVSTIAGAATALPHAVALYGRKAL